jgi:hypothetical protein
MAEERVAPPRPKSRILEFLEVLAKLVGASAVLVVALFANSLQSRLTGVSIQSQREQAESQLRASMFNSLISPIAGPQSDKPMPADREVILTELLALNFNENFEMKPLMEDAIKRLAAEKAGRPKESDDPREALWSIARRIAERQKAAIGREWSASESTKSSGMFSSLGSILTPWKSAADAPQGCRFYYLNLDARTQRHSEPVSPDADCQASAAFRDIVDLKSPDGSYTLRLVAVDPNWEDQTIRVTAQPFLSSQTNPKPTDTQYPFTLTWIDLPLTDNTLLPDGNRFAAYIRSFYNDFQTVGVTVMWFPKGYFTPRERPLNYNEVQELLGRKQ